MPGIDVCFQVDGSDVRDRVADGFSVDGALVHARIFSGRWLNGVHVNDGHRVVEHFGLGFDQFARFTVQWSAF